MASIHKDILIDADLESVWAVVREVGAPQRLFPGLVSAAHLEDGVRSVTFANGLVLRELIVAVDEARRRIAYASVGGRVTHHNASIEISSAGPGFVRLAWTADFLPDDLSGLIGGLMDQGAAVMKQALERRAG